MPTTEELGLLLIALSFLVLLIHSLITGWTQRNVLMGYRELVDGLTSNVPLTDAVEARYLALTPEQRKYADQAFALIGWLATVTPTTADDTLKTWIRQITDGLPNTPPGAPPYTGAQPH